MKWFKKKEVAKPPEKCKVKDTECICTAKGCPYYDPKTTKLYRGN